MRREVFVSTGEGIDVWTADGVLKRQAALEGAGALCLKGRQLLCACGCAVWRLDRQSLAPLGVFSGGPGVCDLKTSPDGRLLYVLCGDADSVLVCDGESGQAMMLNRAGVNPRQMVLEDGILAIAGGESGCVELFDALSLEAIRRISMPGPVYSVCLWAGCVHALCLTERLSSVLVRASQAGTQQLPLPGMPGRLCRAGGRLLVQTQGRLYGVSPDGLRVCLGSRMPARAAQMEAADGKLYLLDALGERVLCADRAGCSAFVCGAKAFVLGENVEE